MEDVVLVGSAKLSQCSLEWHQLPPDSDTAQTLPLARPDNELTDLTVVLVGSGAGE